MNDKWSIALFDNQRDREAVLTLWKSIFSYETAHNDPSLLLDTKERFSDDLLFVARSDEGSVIGTIMAGYDGHRGWLYSLAVSPPYRGNGIGSALVRQAEAALTDLGCLKINLQILEDNRRVEEFYQKLGYVTEPRINMGKPLSANVPGSED